MIVMIVATYRIAISSRMPPISYLTTLGNRGRDRYRRVPFARIC